MFVEEGLRYAISFDKIINTSGNRKLMFRSLAPKMEVEISIIWKKYQVFPIDVWVRRVMSELYFENKEQKPQKIKEFVKNYYGERAGLAQQYLFYWRREL